VNNRSNWQFAFLRAVIDLEAAAHGQSHAAESMEQPAL
jgi:hypothetical protein